MTWNFGPIITRQVSNIIGNRCPDSPSRAAPEFSLPEVPVLLPWRFRNERSPAHPLSSLFARSKDMTEFFCRTRRAEDARSWYRRPRGNVSSGWARAYHSKYLSSKCSSSKAVIQSILSLLLIGLCRIRLAVARHFFTLAREVSS